MAKTGHTFWKRFEVPPGDWKSLPTLVVFDNGKGCGQGPSHVSVTDTPQSHGQWPEDV